MREIIPATWYEKAAKDIVRNGYNLFRWSNENDKGLRKEECDAIGKTPEFQKVLRAERNRFYKELADDPSRSKKTAVGQMLYAINCMLEREQYDKAVASILTLAKIEGWTTEQASVNIFNELQGKDIDAIRLRLQKQASETPKVN